MSTAAAPAATESPPVPLLPPQLAARILSSRFAREGERKQVTVLFADIRGSTELIQELDPEQALHRLEPVLQAMASAVHRYGGTVNRMQGDGIMALFGAPLAHEDHAVRACLAARAMIEAVAQLGADRVEIRVGLNSGEVVVRSVGNDLSMEYDAVGSTAHLAHRLEQLADPGSVFLTGKTAQLAGGFIAVRSRGAVDIKGISRPVEVFELTGAGTRTRWEVRASAHGLARFVGRSRELAILGDALRRAAEGRGQVVAIAGEAGMGKSRVVHEFLHSPAVEGWIALRAAAMPHDRNAPYLLVAEKLRAWIRVTDADDQTEVAAKLDTALATVDDRRALDAAPLRSLLDLPVEDPAWQTLDALQRRRRTHDALRALVLRITAVRPLILVVEDLHWADAESQAVIDAIVDGLGAARLVVIGTYRPEYQNAWARHSYYSLLRLGPLENAAADALLRDLISDDSALAPLRRRIVEQTDATPLFMEEIARSLIETGVLVSEPPSLRLTRSVEDVEIPASVQAVLASRIDRLAVEERTLLQVASVIGKEVSAVLLRAVADVPEQRLYAQLADLQAAEFLYETPGSAGGEYSFKHALTHTVTYESMLLRHRRQLHARVAEAIELHYPDRLDEFTERLAEHALRGESWEKAARYAYKAGQRANARSAFPEATTFFERALEAVAKLPLDRAAIDQAIEIRLGLRVALAVTADLVRIRRYLEEAESLARSIDDRARMAPIVISKSTTLTHLGLLDEAVEAGLYGRSLAEQLDDESCRVNAGFALGQAYWNKGEFEKSAEALAQALELVTAEGRIRYSGTTGTGAVLCLVSLSHTYCFMGLLERATTRAEDALAIAKETGRPYDLSYAHAALGLIYLTTGDLTRAGEQLEEALRIARAGDNTLLVVHAARYLGRAYALSGRLVEARALLGDALGTARAHSLVALQGWCAAALALTQHLDGDSLEAEHSAQGALELARRDGYRALEAHALRVAGEIAMDRADADPGALCQSESLLQEAAALALQLGMRPELAHAQRNLAVLFQRTARIAQAQATRGAVLALYRASGMDAYAAQAEHDIAA